MLLQRGGTPRSEFLWREWEDIFYGESAFSRSVALWHEVVTTNVEARRGCFEFECRQLADG